MFSGESRPKESGCGFLPGIILLRGKNEVWMELRFRFSEALDFPAFANFPRIPVLGSWMLFWWIDLD